MFYDMTIPSVADHLIDHGQVFLISGIAADIHKDKHVDPVKIYLINMMDCPLPQSLIPDPLRYLKIPVQKQIDPQK